MANKPNKRGKSQSGNKNQRSRNKKKSFNKNQIKRAAVDKQVKNPEAGMRLNKYISNSGICSRRDADIYISSGVVTVNGQVVTEMGYKVQLTDDVRFDGRRINPVKKEYILLNKPSGFYVTGSLEKNNRTVMDLIANATKNKVTPVGKLETSAKGLLLFTNDGTLEKKLARTGINELYHVELNKPFQEEDLKQLQEGIRFQERVVKPKEVAYVANKSPHHVGIEIKSSMPQVVQKLFKKLGYEIKVLDRVMYGELTKLNLPRGKYRHLTKQEIINLGIH